MDSKPKSLADHLVDVPDPRKIRGQRHVLLDILLIAILGTLSGVDDWEGIEIFAKAQEAWLRTFLELPNGVPSHDTFNRVFRMLDAKAFTEAFLAWMKGVRSKMPGDVVALDGKTLRGSLAEGKPALHVVSAWSAANHVVLGQRSVDAKSNEITAIPELLKMLELKGCIVTIDAMGCQKEIAKVIVKRKADYVLAVKGNQESLHNAVLAGFARLDADPTSVPHHSVEALETGHGRKELRRTTTIDAVLHLPEAILLMWPKLETLVRIQSKTVRDGKAVTEERFYISTLPMAKVKIIGESVRAHWGIENQLHWVLDVAFREDGIRTRMGNGAETGAILRHITLNLLRQDPNTKESIRHRRLKAALSQEYRLAALLGFPGKSAIA